VAGGGTLMSYVLTMFSKKEYSLTSLKQIIRDFSYNRALKLLFDTSARTYDYIFSSVEGMSVRPTHAYLRSVVVRKLTRQFLATLPGEQHENSLSRW
jgi:hypothetical protein